MGLRARPEPRGTRRRAAGAVGTEHPLPQRQRRGNPHLGRRHLVTVRPLPAAEAGQVASRIRSSNSVTGPRILSPGGLSGAAGCGRVGAICLIEATFMPSSTSSSSLKFVRMSGKISPSSSLTCARISRISVDSSASNAASSRCKPSSRFMVSSASACSCLARSASSVLTFLATAGYTSASSATECLTSSMVACSTRSLRR